MFQLILFTNHCLPRSSNIYDSCYSYTEESDLDLMTLSSETSLWFLERSNLLMKEQFFSKSGSEGFETLTFIFLPAEISILDIKSRLLI